MSLKLRYSVTFLTSPDQNHIVSWQFLQELKQEVVMQHLFVVFVITDLANG